MDWLRVCHTSEESIGIPQQIVHQKSFHHALQPLQLQLQVQLQVQARPRRCQQHHPGRRSKTANTIWQWHQWPKKCQKPSFISFILKNLKTKLRNSWDSETFWDILQSLRPAALGGNVLAPDADAVAATFCASRAQFDETKFIMIIG